jgi:hypothetical protein
MSNTNIIGHIIGLDEIHKKKLIKQLPENVHVIDLDDIQQTVYNSKEILKQKIIWGQLSKDINVLHKQKKLMGSKRVKPKSTDKEIKELMAKRNSAKRNIHSIWKDQMNDQINAIIKEHKDDNILFLGFNIFPKDYRIKINLPFEEISVTSGSNKYSNKMLYDTQSSKYAANQIKYYLNAFSDKIIKGTFPLNLLKPEYLSEKYDKFSNYYHEHNYQPVPDDQLVSVIDKFCTQLKMRGGLINKTIYIATMFKSGDSIPVNSRTPIQGYYTKDDAISALKAKMKKPGPVYIYEISGDQFNIIDGRLIATKTIYPINEESLLLTV